MFYYASLPPPLTPGAAPGGDLWWAPALALLVLVALFVVLFFQTVTINADLDRAERRLMSRTQPVVVEEKRVMRAFSLTVDTKLTQQLNVNPVSKQPPLEEDEMPLVCGGVPRNGAARYTQTGWLVLQRTSQADDLFEAAVLGRTRFAMLGGALCVLRALPPNSKDKRGSEQDARLATLAASGGGDADAAARLRSAAVRTFVIAEAFDARPAGAALGAIECEPASTPLPSRFDELLVQLQRDGGRKYLHVWAWGT
jgi:hypothetical protein